MRIDHAGICTRSPFLSLSGEEVAERELARMESILSDRSDGGFTERPVIPVTPSRRSKNNLVALGLVGCLGTAGTLFLALTLPSLGIALRSGIAGPDVAPVPTAPPLSIAADSSLIVQSGRSTSIDEGPNTSKSIDRASPPLEAKTPTPARSVRSAMRTIGQRERQVRGVVAKGHREAAMRPIRSRRLATGISRLGRSANEVQATWDVPRQCRTEWRICRTPHGSRERELARSRWLAHDLASRVASRRRS